MLLGDNLSYAELYPLLEAAQAQLGRQINSTCYTTTEWTRKHKDSNNLTDLLVAAQTLLIAITKLSYIQYRKKLPNVTKLSTNATKSLLIVSKPLNLFVTN